MVVIVMMVVMITGCLRRGLCVRRRTVRALRYFQQRPAAAGAVIVSLAIGRAASRTRLNAFGFRVHIHGFFRALLQGESLNCLEDGGFGLRAQLGIAHAVSKFPSGSTCR